MQRRTTLRPTELAAMHEVNKSLVRRHSSRRGSIPLLQIMEGTKKLVDKLHEGNIVEVRNYVSSHPPTVSMIDPAPKISLAFEYLTETSALFFKTFTSGEWLTIRPSIPDLFSDHDLDRRYNLPFRRRQRALREKS